MRENTHQNLVDCREGGAGDERQHERDELAPSFGGKVPSFCRKSPGEEKCNGGGEKLAKCKTRTVNSFCVERATTAQRARDDLSASVSI